MQDRNRNRGKADGSSRVRRPVRRSESTEPKKDDDSKGKDSYKARRSFTRNKSLRQQKAGSKSDSAKRFTRKGDSPFRGREKREGFERRERPERDDSRRSFRRDDSKGDFKRDDGKREYKRGDSKSDFKRGDRRDSGRDDSKRDYKRDAAKRGSERDDSKRSYRRTDNKSGFDRGDSRKSYNRTDSRRGFEKDDTKSDSERDSRKRDVERDDGKPDFEGEKGFNRRKKTGDGEERSENRHAARGPWRGRKSEQREPGRRTRRDDEKEYAGRFGSGERRNTGFGSRNEPSDERAQKPARVRGAAPKAKQATGDGLIRLNKYLANSGVSSRREADKLIESGAVKVNGVVVNQLGYKIKPDDKVTYGDTPVKGEKKVYLLLNKPKDYISTVDDPAQRKTVMDLIKGACRERVYPVGRLDRNTTGLLLFTNDGELTTKLTHPKFGIRKVYHVTLDRGLKPDDFKALTEGIELEDGPIKADDLAFVGEGKKEVGIEIHSGRNRVIRRMFEQLGYDVTHLDRVLFAGLTKKDLPRGRYRFLTDREISFLKMLG